MEDFQASFAKIFQTLVNNKIQLDKNFLYLGIMLVTLYLSLSELGGENFDIRHSFKREYPISGVVSFIFVSVNWGSDH